MTPVPLDATTLRTVLTAEYRWTSAQVADLLRRLQRRSGTDVVQPPAALPPVARSKASLSKAKPSRKRRK